MDSSLGLGPLGVNLNSSSLSPSVLHKIEALEREDCASAIGRMARMGHELSESGELRIEFLRFMALQHFLDSPIAPSKVVDDFWHAFILETHAYVNFCNTHFGEYVHHYHDPNTPRTYQKTRTLIFELFPSASEKTWTEGPGPCSSGGLK